MNINLAHYWSEILWKLGENELLLLNILENMYQEKMIDGREYYNFIF